MRKAFCTLLLLGAAGCAIPMAAHDRARLDMNQSYICMGPNGELAQETYADEVASLSPMRCPAPARYIRLPWCVANDMAPPDTAAMWRDRLRDARDNSLHGDGFEGRTYCAAVKGGPPLPPPVPTTAAVQPRLRAQVPIVGFNKEAIRSEVEKDVGDVLGGEAVQLAKTASSSIMVTLHQGLPRPIQRANGSWTYEGPSAAVAIRTAQGWMAWRKEGHLPLSVAASEEIDRILADPEFRREPAYVEPTCTDAGAQRLVLRHLGRESVRQQSCGGSGLTYRLFRLVLDTP